MHATCANGVTVVGIDNGYGAACAVARIVRSLHPDQTQAKQV
jgi:NCAIR mutase (PurE)-related protein